MSIKLPYILSFKILSFGIMVILAGFLMTVPLFSQQESNGFKHQVGAAAGFSTGYGLSYRYWPGNWGIQGTFSPYYDNSGPMISLGVAGLRLIEDNGWSRFFLYLGNHFHFDSVEDYNYQTETSTYRPITTYVIGIGQGLEFLIKRRLGINLMFGVAAYMDTDNYFMTNLTGETGLYYRF